MSLISNDDKRFREFHINQLPIDRLFILLDKSFHDALFRMIKNIGFNEFNNQFFDNNLNLSTFKQWKSRKHFIPLWFIIKLCKNHPVVSLKAVEKNIIAYKGPSTSAVITNPELPIKENSRLLKILAHLLGDGSVGGGFGSKFPKGKQHSEYRNFTPKLLDSFEKDLSVFGTVPTTKNYKHGSLIIPNLIGYILEHVYDIKFDTFNSRVPKCLFNLSPDLIASFLRAFGDDEGHVYDSSIEYYSNNKELISDVLVLMNGCFPMIKTSNMKMNAKAGKNIKYSFMIYHCSQKFYLNLIGFDHSQKRKDMLFNINRSGKRIHINPKQKIVDLLESENLTAKQISRMMKIRHSTVLDYLNDLKKQTKVKIIRKIRWANVWTS